MRCPAPLLGMLGTERGSRSGPQTTASAKPKARAFLGGNDRSSEQCLRRAKATA